MLLRGGVQPKRPLFPQTSKWLLGPGGRMARWMPVVSPLQPTGKFGFNLLLLEVQSDPGKAGPSSY